MSIPQAGLRITAAAILMGVGAPLFACRGPVGTDGACAGLLVPDAQRGKAITLVFLGWSVASVLAMPLSAWIGGLLGWRWALGLVAVLALLVSGWVWRAMSDGIRPAALSRQAWMQTLGSSALMLAVGVTLLSSFGQFTLFSYFAPDHQQVLGLGAGALSLRLLWFGAFGLTGHVLVSRRIDRLGAPRAVLITLGGMALSLLLWSLGASVWWIQALTLTGLPSVLRTAGLSALGTARRRYPLGPGLLLGQFGPASAAGAHGAGHGGTQRLGHLRRAGTGRRVDCAGPDAAAALVGPGADAGGHGAELAGTRVQKRS